MSAEALVIDRRGPVSWARMNRPEVLCALDQAQLRRLLDWLRSAGDDDSTAVLVLTGTGRAFSAGADIREADAQDDADFAVNTALYQDLARTCAGLAKPVIAAVNGICLGGGLELAAMCDLRIAARSARLGLPDASLGFSVSGGLSWFLPRQIGAGRTMELYLTERILDAAEAERIGLVGEVVDDGDLAERAQELAERIAGFPRCGVANMKALLNQPARPLDEALVDEEARDRACFSDPEARKRLASFLEARRKRR